MRLVLILLGSSLTIYGCSSFVERSAPSSHLLEANIGVFVSSTSRLQISPTELTVHIGNSLYPLIDCSNETFRCLKNEELGFHFVAPRLCRQPYHVEGDRVGGYNFSQMSMVEHGDARQGRYDSSISDRFAYLYYFDRGLVEIRYDPSGHWRFGPGSNGDTLSRAEMAPYIYRLPDNQTFMRCS